MGGLRRRHGRGGRGGVGPEPFLSQRGTEWHVASAFQSATVLHGGDWAAIGFGLTVGLAGVLGDLAESLIKRDCRRKDASDTVPGFGGVLDVIDSILFAAPVAYLWLRW